MQVKMKPTVRYQSDKLFFILLPVCVALSMWLARYIPDNVFDQFVAPVLITGSVAVAFFGSWIIFRHSEDLRTRKLWGYTLLAWGIADSAYLVCWFFAPMVVMDMGAYKLTPYELLIGNLLGWFLLLYPTEALRPRWLNLRRSLWQLLPMCALLALNYLVRLNLEYLLIIYPLVLLALLLSHVRAYRIWCEENFSTLDDIDVRWIVRYLFMAALMGIVFLYMCLSHSHSRGFTQLWLVIFMFVYSTEQILFRRDPWMMLQHSEKEESPLPLPDDDSEEMEELPSDDGSNDALRQTLEQWMEREKPYTNPEFRLMDLQQVLPMNRTYLSRFLQTEFDCTFYQFVNRYRIDEAMRLKMDNPDMKIGEIAARCGFSSPTVFTRTFTNITGITPREWARKNS